LYQLGAVDFLRRIRAGNVLPGGGGGIRATAGLD